MRIAVGHLGISRRSLWEGDALTTYWDIGRGELVVHGDADNQAFVGVVSSALENRKLKVEIEDMGPTRLRWQGSVQSAEFQSFGLGRAECFLRISLDN